MVLQTRERRIKVLKELCNAENWQPCISKISRKLGIPASTIHDIFKSRKERFLLKIKFLSEIECYDYIESGMQISYVADNRSKITYKYGCLV